MEKEKNNPECGIRPGLPTGARLVHAGPQGPISVSFCVSDSFVQHLAVVLASLAAAFVWGHIKGFFWFTYTKKRVRRTLCCGVLVHKKKMKG